MLATNPSNTDLEINLLGYSVPIRASNPIVNMSIFLTDQVQIDKLTTVIDTIVTNLPYWAVS